MPHFHAIINMPGYLPEGDPQKFDTADEAWRYLGDELERSWDAEYDGVPEGTPDEVSEAKLTIDGRYLEAHTRIHNHPTGGGVVPLEGPTDTHLGWVYSVQQCSQECED